MNFLDTLLSRLRRTGPPPVIGRGLAGGHSVSAIERMLHGHQQDTNTVAPALRQNRRPVGGIGK